MGRPPLVIADEWHPGPSGPPGSGIPRTSAKEWRDPRRSEGRASRNWRRAGASSTRVSSRAFVLARVVGGRNGIVTASVWSWRRGRPRAWRPCVCLSRSSSPRSTRSDHSPRPDADACKTPGRRARRRGAAGAHGGAVSAQRRCALGCDTMPAAERRQGRGAPAGWQSEAMHASCFGRISR